MTRPGSSTADDKPTWSPDGTRIAFQRVGLYERSSRDAIFVVPARGGQARRLASGVWAALDWSPDGSTIAAAGLDRRLQTVDPKTGAVADSHVLLPVGSGDLAYSPDGRRLAVAADRGVYVVELSSGRTTRVETTRSAASATWSPNGRRIAFTADDVFVVGIDGRGLRRLRREGHNQDVEWRP